MRRGEHRARELGRRAQRLEREREERARAAVLDERSRIARELHDVVAHGVSLMVVQAGGARLVLDTPGGADRVRAHLRTIEASGRQALDEMRRLLAWCAMTTVSALEPLPGMERLDALTESTRSRRGPAAGPTSRASRRHCLPGIDLTAYRIVQEALTNVIRHAGAVDAELTVRYGPTRLELEIARRRARHVRPMPTAAATGWSGCASARRSTAARSRPATGPRAATRCASGCR